MSEAYLYFPGCNIPYRERGYEVSARAVAEKLGIELMDKPFTCCGINVEPIDEFASLLYSARNIAIAEEEGMDLVTLCNGCYKTLKVANERLKNDENLRNEVNKKLMILGREVKGDIEVKHFLDIIVDKIDDDVIVKKVKVRVAPHIGCHAQRPSEYVDFGADIKIDRILELVGSTSLKYKDKDKCCGAPLLALSEEMGMTIANNKLTNMKEAGAELIVTMCPFCQVSLDTLQVKIESDFGEKYDIPSIYITQILGIAIGIPYENLGIEENKTNPEKVFKKDL